MSSQRRILARVLVGLAIGYPLKLALICLAVVR